MMYFATKHEKSMEPTPRTVVNYVSRGFKNFTMLFYLWYIKIILKFPNLENGVDIISHEYHYTTYELFIWRHSRYKSNKISLILSDQQPIHNFPLFCDVLDSKALASYFTVQSTLLFIILLAVITD